MPHTSAVTGVANLRRSALNWTFEMHENQHNIMRHDNIFQAIMSLSFLSSRLNVALPPRSAAYSHSGGPVERPEVCLRPLPWSGHRLLFFLRPNAPKTQAETGMGSSEQAGSQDLSFCCCISVSNTKLVSLAHSLSRYQTWVARHLPFFLTTSITPCVRLTARPSLHSPMLRSL